MSKNPIDYTEEAAQAIFWDQKYLQKRLYNCARPVVGDVTV